MNKMFLSTLFFTVLLTSEVTYYWNLGIAIKKDKPVRRIVQKEVNLSNSTFYAQATNVPQGVYTLQTNYLIAPEKQNLSFLESNNFISNSSKTIKDLIISEEYFEAAKQIITLEESKINAEFESADDFHYWSSFVYFNLGNQEFKSLVTAS